LNEGEMRANERGEEELPTKIRNAKNSLCALKHSLVCEAKYPAAATFICLDNPFWFTVTF
jgi:hypothetical protein